MGSRLTAQDAPGLAVCPDCPFPELVFIVLQQLRSKHLIRVHAYWTEIRGDRPYPLIGDILPKDLVAELPHLAIFDVERDPLRFLCRLEGTAIVAMMGADITGEYFDTLEPGELIAKALTVFKQVAETGVPQLIYEEYDGGSNIPRSIERLIMPASTDGKTIDRIFAAMVRSDVDDADPTTK